MRPGEYIQDELDERGWSRNVLAIIMKMSIDNIEDIINGNTPIDSEIATKLGNAFGTSTALWENLEKAYRG